MNWKGFATEPKSTERARFCRIFIFYVHGMHDLKRQVHNFSRCVRWIPDHKLYHTIKTLRGRRVKKISELENCLLWNHWRACMELWML